MPSTRTHETLGSSIGSADTIIGQVVLNICAASFSGTYGSGTLAPLSQSGVFDIAALNSTGAGALTGTQDQNVAGTLSSDVALTAIYAVNSAGRVAITPGAGSASAVYIISPTKALMINLSSANPVVQELVH